MKRLKAFLKEAISTVVIAVVIAFMIKFFIVDNRVIPTSSMYPTIYEGDMLLVNKSAYYFRSPARGDIIVFKSAPEISQKDLIKRVIGLPGEKVEVRDKQVFINGKALEEYYINEEPQYVFGPVVVPEGFLFVLGDNRNQSYDGHQWPEPFLDQKKVKGKAFYRYWPPKRSGWLSNEGVRYENTSHQ